MELLLLFILIAAEILFLIFEAVKKSSDKKTWTIRRLIVNAGEIVLYCIMLLLPGIDTGFRFTGLIILLVVRVVFAGIFALANRKKTGIKKTGLKVMSLIVSVILICGAMVPAFLFTDYEGRPVTGPYTVTQCNCILVDESRIEAFENDGSKREVPAYFFAPAEAKEGEKFPLVVFSHGAFGYYQSNTSTYMELASHGYVVVSLDHPYHSFFTKDTNGNTIIVDRDFIQSAMMVGGDNNPLSEEETYELTSKWMQLRISDMNFVIDELKAAAQMSDLDESWYIDGKGQNQPETVQTLLGAVNTDKIGLMGHSLGGATAVTVGRRNDVSAVVDLDGTMLGEETGVVDGKLQYNEEPYNTPLFNLISELHHESEGEAEAADYSYVNTVVLSHAENGHETYIKNSAHMNFTDLPLFSPALSGFLGTGSVDAGECIDQVNALVLQFFDCYLKDGQPFSPEEYY